MRRTAIRSDLIQASLLGLYAVPVLLLLGTLALVLHYGFDSRLGGATATLWLVGGPILTVACPGIGALIRIAVGVKPQPPPTWQADRGRVTHRRTGWAVVAAIAVFVLGYAFLTFWGMLGVATIAFFGGMAGPGPFVVNTVRGSAAIAAFFLARYAYRRIRRR